MDPSADPASSFLRSFERRSAFLENIVQTCPEGIIANDNEGKIFLFNASAQRIFGYTPEEAIGQISASRLYPPGGAREVKEYLYSEEYGGRGHLVDFETEVLRKNGRKAPIRLCCSVIKENGKEIGYIGFFTDISARIALQAKFLESEERFRGIFESARDAIVSVGEDGKVLMANRAAQDLLGYGEDTLLGMVATRLFADRFTDYWKELSVYASGLGPTMDTGFRHGGEEFLVLLPETTAMAAVIPAERLRKRFSSISFLPLSDEEPRKVTLSIGIAEYHPGITIDDLVRSADQAMYAAKNAGRNRTMVYEPVVAKSDG